MASPAERARPEEWLSIGMAVFATILAPVGIRLWKGPTMEFAQSDFVARHCETVGNVATCHIPGGAPFWWNLPLWIGLIYLIVQMAFLLQSASQVRALGVLDSIVAILPLVAGLVLLALNIVDPQKFHFTSYQHGALAVLIIVSAAEFLLTIWIRFVVNRRTIGMSDGGN